VDYPGYGIVPNLIVFVTFLAIEILYMYVVEAESAQKT